MSAAIGWLEWGPEAFDRARIEDKPVLLSITASWCHWCHEMDRVGYADPAVAAFVQDRFVPVRVDADRRPDIAERYHLGGFPTTAFLTPGGQILGGGTYFGPDRLGGILEQVVSAYGLRRHEIRAKAAGPAGAAGDSAGEPAGGTEDRDTILRGICGRIGRAFDPEHGGFGVEPKFPLADPLELCLARGDDDVLPIVTVTLDAMAAGGLHDRVDGGFFRYATTRDWQLPHVEKLLETNAALLRIYLLAGAALHAPQYLDVARDIVRYVERFLADTAHGGFFASQAADEAYYALPERARADTAPPAVDHGLFSDWNGRMVSAWFLAGRVLDDPGLTSFAVESLERVVQGAYKPGAGVAHIDADTSVRGLLTDQVAVAAALLDAHDVTGREPYAMLAEELMRYALRVMWDGRRGGFFDRAMEGTTGRDIGLLREPLKPLAPNCEAARVLLRLAAVSGEPDLRARAGDTLHAMAADAAEQGVSAAAYALAILDSASEPRVD